MLCSRQNENIARRPPAVARMEPWWALRDHPPPSPGMVRLCPWLWQAWVLVLVAGSALLLEHDIWIYAGWVDRSRARIASYMYTKVASCYQQQ